MTAGVITQVDLLVYGISRRHTLHTSAEEAWKTDATAQAAARAELRYELLSMQLGHPETWFARACTRLWEPTLCCLMHMVITTRWRSRKA
jgi:hypothetical protein